MTSRTLPVPAPSASSGRATPTNSGLSINIPAPTDGRRIVRVDLTINLSYSEEHQLLTSSSCSQLTYSISRTQCWLNHHYSFLCPPCLQSCTCPFQCYRCYWAGCPSFVLYPHVFRRYTPAFSSNAPCTLGIHTCVLYSSANSSARREPTILSDAYSSPRTGSVLPS